MRVVGVVHLSDGQKAALKEVMRSSPYEINVQNSA